MTRWLFGLRFRWGIASVLTFSMVSVIVLVMILTTALDVTRERTIFRNQLEKRALLLIGTLKDVVADALYFLDVDKVADITSTISKSQPEIRYIQIFRPDGTLLTDTRLPNYRIGILGQKYAQTSLQSNQIILEYEGDDLKVTGLIKVGKEIIGVVHFDYSAESLNDEIRGIVLQHIWQSLGLIVLGLGLSYVIAQYFVRPIRRLVRATKRVAEGEFEFSSSNRRGDEIGELTAAFAEMTRRLQERSADLKHAYEQLQLELAERKRAERQLIQAGRLAAIGTLASGVVHEVNNPLSGALGRVDLLLRGELDNSLRADLQVVRDETQRATRTMQNLLSFAREHKVEVAYTSINDIVDNILDIRSYQFQVNNIELRKELQAGLPKTMADPHQLQQVFLNLIINAEQAMAEIHSRGLLSVKTRNVENAIHIFVADDGPGIPKEDLTRIFDPFFTTKAEGKGTGLGLSICYGIVQQHGGNIHVDSQVGKGSTFTVELPIISETIPQKREGVSPTAN